MEIVQELDGVDETLEHLIPGDGGGLNVLLAPGVEVWEILLRAGLDCFCISCCNLKAI